MRQLRYNGRIVLKYEFKRVGVDLGSRSYNINIGHGLLDNASDFIKPLLPRAKTVIVTDRFVHGNHYPRLKENLEYHNIHCDSIVLDRGEGTKSWKYLEYIVEQLLAKKIERNDPIIGLGGGVIGDITGFAAAVTRRGIPFIQIPTTLLAQVDSSVGGKTSINSSQGKNLVGAIYQPSLVLSDLSVLDTLSKRDFMAGYGEVLKYSLLGDRDFYEWLDDHADQIKKLDQETMGTIVKKSCEIKAYFVSNDEREHGIRAKLNLGHTFGHALETATGYSDMILHGEAIAIGCKLAFELSCMAGHCPPEDVIRVANHMNEMGMLDAMKNLKGNLPPADDLIEIMKQDKKARGGVLNFILVNGIGKSFATNQVDMGMVREVLEKNLP